jgi:Fe-S cluster assembly protein SufD
VTRDEVRDHWVRAFEAHAAVLPGAGHEALARARREAIDAFAERGFPTRRDEDWKQTDVSVLAEQTLTPGKTQGHVSPAPAGVSIRPLAETLERNPFVALNTALFDAGWLIEIEPGTRAALPLELQLGAAETAEPAASHPRILVVAREGSEATIVERYTGAGAYLRNPVSEILLEGDARVTHVRVQEESPEAWHVGTLAAHLERGSRLDSSVVTLGACLSRVDVEIRLAGEETECRLDGLYLAAGSAHTDHHTTIDHAMPHTRSQESYKGILAGRARGVFRGRIHVRPHAQKIAAEQSNRNLLLSDDASVHTKPQLEIHADDVRCSHGAAIGRLDEDALFYLRSRGIALPDARALLTYAFASEILERIPDAALRASLEQYVLDWLPRNAAGGKGR